MKPDVAKYINLGYMVVNKFLSQNPQLYDIKEDLEQEALLGIVEAAHQWEDTGDIKFSTYAAHSAQQKMLMFLRDNENKYNRICSHSLEELTLESDEGESMGWEDIVSGHVLDVDTILPKLTPKSQEILVLVNKGLNRYDIRTLIGVGWREYSKRKRALIEELKELVK